MLLWPRPVSTRALTSVLPPSVQLSQWSASIWPTVHSVQCSLRLYIEHKRSVCEEHPSNKIGKRPCIYQFLPHSPKFVFAAPMFFTVILRQRSALKHIVLKIL